MNTIESAINNYFQAYMNADSEKLLESFHTETILYSVDDGKIDKTEMSAWVENLKKRKQIGDVRKGELKIISVDSLNNVAVAKIKIQLPNLEFTDFLSFLKINEQWKVVGKIYSVKVLSAN